MLERLVGSFLPRSLGLGKLEEPWRQKVAGFYFVTQKNLWLWSCQQQKSVFFSAPQKKFFGERSTAAWLETWSCDFLPNHHSFASESPRSFRLAERPGWLPLLLGRGDFQWSCFWQMFETDLCACLRRIPCHEKGANLRKSTSDYSDLDAKKREFGVCLTYTPKN